eukprot:4792449-Prymnesium_polylepis.2
MEYTGVNAESARRFRSRARAHASHNDSYQRRGTSASCSALSPAPACHPHRYSSHRRHTPRAQAAPLKR